MPSNPQLPLSRFNPPLSQAFAALCTTLPVAAIPELNKKITTHVQTIKDARRENEFLDLDLAQAIAESLRAVLADYDQYSASQQALIVGATRYFIHDGDVERDTISVLGLDDDAEVLNYVLAEIGRSDLKVDVA